MKDTGKLKVTQQNPEQDLSVLALVLYLADHSYNLKVLGLFMGNCPGLIFSSHPEYLADAKYALAKLVFSVRMGLLPRTVPLPTCSTDG